MVFAVILRAEVALANVHRRALHIGRNDAVDHAVAVLMHQRGDGARRALKLHKAVSRPAAGIKEAFHQEASAKIDKLWQLLKEVHWVEVWMR